MTFYSLRFQSKVRVTFEPSPPHTKCVRLPVINEFVRHKQTGKWSKVSSVGERGTIELLPFLADDPTTPATPSQGTPKPDADADTADKSLKKTDADAARSCCDKSFKTKRMLMLLPRHLFPCKKHFKRSALFLVLHKKKVQIITCPMHTVWLQITRPPFSRDW